MPDTDTPQASPEPGEASPVAARAASDGSTSDAIRYTRLTWDVPEDRADELITHMSGWDDDVLRVEEVDESQWPLVRKVAAAMAETERIEKRGQAAQAQGGYQYATVEDMLNMVRGPLFGRGVILITRPRGFTEHTITSSNNNEGTRLVLKVDFEFMDGESSFKIEGWEGEGQDYGDKSYGKAYTNAVKTFIRTTWLLPTGDDPEATDPGERRAQPKNGNGRAPQLPEWAREASDIRKQEGLKALGQVVGAQRALGIFKGMKDHHGLVPDVAVAMAKVIATAHAAATATPQEKAEARAPRAEAEQADRAAEAPDAVPDAEVVEEPPPGTGELPADAAERPTPGSVKAPNLKGVKNDDEKRERYREAGCICEDPLTGADDGDDQCPIIQHGIPF